MNAVCTTLTAAYLLDLHPDNLLHPDAWHYGRCLWLNILNVLRAGSGTLLLEDILRPIQILETETSVRK